MDIQSWASAASVLAVLLTAIGMLSRKTDAFHAELNGEIGELRTDLRADIGRVESRLSALEQRTVELSARLPPLPAAAP